MTPHKEPEIKQSSTHSKRAVLSLLASISILAGVTQGISSARADESYSNSSVSGVRTEVFGDKDRNFRLPSDVKYGESHSYPRVEDVDGATGARRGANGVVDPENLLNQIRL